MEQNKDTVREALEATVATTREEYLNTVKKFKETEAEFNRIKKERAVSLIKTEVALIKLNMFNGRRYIVKIGGFHYDVVDIEPAEDKYNIFYKTSKGETKNIIRMSGPWLKPVIFKDGEYKV